ncbi:MAG: hypothetical protein PHC38_02340 [Weeksellaceae bacterium]|jgi:hypothetical protein|nr:hypothetical protein [Weeksellaceae bacterium]
MNTALSKNDLELRKAFETIPSIKQLSNSVLEISQLVFTCEISRETIQDVLDKHQIENITSLKEELLDLLIAYVNLILDDHIVSESERFNIEILKKYFRIKEGDFYTHRYSEIENILHRQFERIYSDNDVNLEEAIHKVALQEVFDLSYDQFEEFKQNEISRAIEQGADATTLDIASLYKPEDKIEE